MFDWDDLLLIMILFCAITSYAKKDHTYCWHAFTHDTGNEDKHTNINTDHRWINTEHKKA